MIVNLVIVTRLLPKPSLALGEQLLLWLEGP